MSQANQALADRKRFVLDDHQWAEFEKELDRPVHDKPRLRELLMTPGLVFTHTEVVYPWALVLDVRIPVP